jgi:hypothetical protein
MAGRDRRTFLAVPEEKVYALGRRWRCTIGRWIVVWLRRFVVVGRRRIVVGRRRRDIDTAIVISVISVVLLMMLIVAMTAGEYGPHRSAADHDAEAKRNRKLTHLTDLADPD